MGVRVAENLYGKYGVPTLDLVFTSPRAGLKNVAGDTSLEVEFTRTQDTQASYVKSDGTIGYASTDVARFDHDPVTGESLGLLVEESRINQSINSENALTWQNIGGQTTNVQSDIATAPDGSISADNIFAASGTRPAKSAFDIGSSFDVLNNQYLILSVFAKKVPGSKFGFLNLNINFAGSGVPRVNFNLTTGESTEYDDNQGYSEEIGNGWYRLVAYYQNTTGSTQTWSNTNTVRFFPVENNTDHSASGAGTGSTTDGTYIWGRQIEVATAPYPTSYIPTSGTTVTRAADVSTSALGVDSFFNQEQSTIYAEGIFIGDPYTGDFGYFATLDIGVNDNSFYSRVRLQDSNDTIRFRSTLPSSGTTTGAMNLSIGANAKNTPIKWCHSITDGVSASGAVNGNTGTGAISGNIQVPDRLQIGKQGTAYLTTCHVKRLSYFPTRLSDATLQSITS